MSTGYKIANEGHAYFVTFTVVDWVDIFTRRVYKEEVVKSLRYCQENKGLLIYAYLIMSNHIHLIISSQCINTLSDIIRDFKKYTANRILDLIKTEAESRREWMLERFRMNASQHQRNSHYQIWQHQNHAEEIHSLAFFSQKQKYIHENPIRAGWVSRAEDYLFSSAYNFEFLETKLHLSDWYGE